MSVRIVTHTPDPEHLMGYCARVSSPKNQKRMEAGELGSAGLLKFCSDHGHWSVFELANVVMEVKTTRAISAQILRHRSFACQELSQRYRKIDELPQLPEMRLAGSKNRQSSLDVVNTPEVKGIVEDAVCDAFEKYDALVANHGIATETARMILPMCAPTTLYMNGTVRSWIHYISVRCKPDVQKEHREIALAIRRELSKILPICAEAFGWND